MNMLYIKKPFFLKIVLLSLLAACSGSSPSISILPSTETLSNNNSFSLKLDILWVVDLSRSMAEETENVRNNISLFMNDFVQSDYDYQVGVISTAAWSDLAYAADPTKSFLVQNNIPVFNRLHKGECVDYNASVNNDPILSSLNTNSLGAFITKFNTNFDIYGASANTSSCGLVGPPFKNFEAVPGNIFDDSRFTAGQREQLIAYTNDERPLQSMKAFLESGYGASSFLRNEAYLAVILITDEPDSSRDSLIPESNYDLSSGGLHKASQYLSFLDNLKKSRNNYSVFSIIKTDGSNPLDAQVADQSGGRVFSIDGNSTNYQNNLSTIKEAILKESTRHYLKSEPVVKTLKVTIVKENGQVIEVPFDNGNGGFSYIEGVNALQFSSPYIPAKNDSLTVLYDNASLGESSQKPEPKIIISKKEVSENAANGTTVGNLSILNINNDVPTTYTLVSDSSGGAFSISSSGKVTLVDNSLIDAESQALHRLDIEAVNSQIEELTGDILIIVKDVIDAIPIAASDQYSTVETNTDESGIINISGNVSYNDTNIDISEPHTYTLIETPTKGTASLHSKKGSFSYRVPASSLSLGAGQSHIEELDYTLSDAAGNTSTATITVTIHGSNQPPELYNPISDLVVSITEGENLIMLDNTSFESSGLASGSATDGNDGNNNTTLTTSAPANGAHYIKYSFAGTSLYEISKIEMVGGHSLGNTILQVVSENDEVLTREVIGIGQGSSIVSPFSIAAIGKKVRLIRPNGSVNSTEDQDIKLSELKVYGYEAKQIQINLLDHFSDADQGDTLTFYATDELGEGPAPAWVQVNGNFLKATPPAGADTNIGVLAQDSSGATDFTVFNLKRTGGATINNPPLVLLNIDDTQRGGMSLKRYGGPSSSNNITWSEGDEFVDQALDSNGNFISPVFPDNFDQENEHGDTEDGWDPNPVLETNKFAQSGRLVPLVNYDRKYGEVYTGYMAPAYTGIYRFRSTQVDDIVRLLVAPSEYISDLQRVITGAINSASIRNIMKDSLVYTDPMPLTTQTEFFPNSIGGPHNTSRFFEHNPSGYSPGYVYFEKGNLYTFQVRFMEGGGAVEFDFEYSYKKTPSSTWSTWKPIDASFMIPKDGVDAHTPRVISGNNGVDFDATKIFYDAEFDILVYTAKLVNPDGSSHIGLNNSSDVSEIGLFMNPDTGRLSGTLNSHFLNSSPRPRVAFTAKEKFSSTEKSVTSLPIKIDPAL